MGVGPTTLMRWRTAADMPKAHSMRKAAEAMGVPIQSALVAAGYMRADEAKLQKVTVSVPLDPSTLSNEELAEEFVRRLGGDPDGPQRGRPVLAMGSNESADPKRRGRRPSV